MYVAGRLRVVFTHEIVDVSGCHDGEQEKGGRPFASGKVEFRFHAAKIPPRTRGCQEGDPVFYEQAVVEFLRSRSARHDAKGCPGWGGAFQENKNKIMFIKKCKVLKYKYIRKYKWCFDSYIDEKRLKIEQKNVFLQRF